MGQGYYIETCVRMRYKAEYAPSDLLCSRAGVWVPYDRVAGALRADPSCILSQVTLPSRGHHEVAYEAVMRCSEAVVRGVGERAASLGPAPMPCVC